MSWRVEDERMLERLEDESVIERLFAFMTGGADGARDAETVVLSRRASGLLAEVRRLPGGTAAVVAAARGEGVAGLARFIDQLSFKDCPPELVHHLALFLVKVAAVRERHAPELAVTTWLHALAAWLVLAEERTYLARLSESVVGVATTPSRDAGIPPERVPLELLAILSQRAGATARDLGLAGRIALLVLARTDEAVRIAGAPAAAADRVRAEADRYRNAAIESALAVIGEGLDEASARGELTTAGAILMLRAIPVWTWTSYDEAVEHFVVDRIDKIGWELYRARNWDSLRYLLDPFRPVFDSLAVRIERDPTRIAYAAGCAQMFVFLAEVERSLPRKIELAERAVKICPIHRNGRLVLASALCEQAMETMRAMSFFARRHDIERVEALLARTELLYPETRDLGDAKGMLDRVKKGRITV